MEGKLVGGESGTGGRGQPNLEKMKAWKTFSVAGSDLVCVYIFIYYFFLLAKLYECF